MVTLRSCEKVVPSAGDIVGVATVCNMVYVASAGALSAIPDLKALALTVAVCASVCGAE
jgi:hypothetical protein